MNRNAGFTLIELMISILLIMVVMLMINSMFVSAQKIYTTAADRVDVFSQARVALDAIEMDIQRMTPIYGDLIMMSQEPVDEYSKESYRERYLDLAFDRAPDNASTLEIDPLLAFYTTTSWWSEAKQAYESGTAQVVYYLRRKPDQHVPALGRTVQPTTAYLMRRVIPRRVFNVTKLGPDAFKIPPEEEIASSILSARVYAFNNGAVAYMIQSNTAVELFSCCNSRPHPVAALLRDNPMAGGQPPKNPGATPAAPTAPGTPGAAPAGTPAGGTDPAINVLRPLVSKVGKTYSFGGTAGGISQYLASREYLPLHIGIEITFADAQFEIDGTDLDGTLRTISRVISVPNSEPVFVLPRPEDAAMFRSAH